MTVSLTSPEATTLPSRSSSAWVNPGGISSTWWVTRTSAGASGSAARSASRRTRSSRPPRSSPAAGSSSSNSSGSVISARAICTRLRSPSDSVPYARSASPPTPTWSSRARARDESSVSYASRNRPTTDQAAVSTASRTVSSGGIRSCTATEVSPIRVRSSNTSVRPSRAPSTSTVPRDGCSRAAARFSRVVLPAPLGPSTTQRSSSSTRQSTSRSRSLPPRVTVACSTAMTRSGSGCTTVSCHGAHGRAARP